MKILKKGLSFISLIFTLILFSSCGSDNEIKEVVKEEIIEETICITSLEMLSKEHSFSVIKSNLYNVDSLVICLFPSPVNYADLTPIIAYEGANIEYKINNETYQEYSSPESIDFSYPNIVAFKISNIDTSISKVYRIIVDTEHPILFNNSEIVIPDSPINITYHGLEIDTCENVGNYPIRLTLRTTEYTDIVTPTENVSNVFSTTLTSSESHLNPKEEGKVNVYASNVSETGTYKATALFKLYFNEALNYIVYDDFTGNYVYDIGYQKAELKLKGNFID